MSLKEPKQKQKNYLARRIISGITFFGQEFNYRIYNNKNSVLTAVQYINNINAALVAIFLVYNFGFIVPTSQSIYIYWYLEAVVIINVLFFCIKALYSLHIRTYIISNYLESILTIFIITHISLKYIDVNIIKIIYDSLWILYDYQTFYYDLLSGYLLLFTILQIAQFSVFISSIPIKPATTFIISFIILIFSGALALMMPAMTTKGSMRFIDALFTSASASCVTGLAVVDTPTFFTFKGQIVILILIQLGGIGIVAFASFFATFLSQGVGIKQQALMQDMLSSETLSSAKDMLRKIIILTFTIELIGAIAVFFSFNHEVQFQSLSQKIYFSIFHSISAFCNAGFSLFTNNLNEPFVNKSYILHIVIALIISMGSLGFSTIEDVFSIKKMRERTQKPWKKWEIGSEIAVNMSILLIISGAILFFLTETKYTLQNKTFLEASVASFFQSVTTRTAGFNTVDMGALATPTILILIILMFIGAAPGSTGGGIKTTTFWLLIVSSISNIQGKKNVEISKRTISNDTINKAFSLFFLAIVYNIICIMLLTTVQSEVPILNLVFEQISAFGTVGLSLNLTPTLNDYSKTIIIITMYIGRVGSLTLALALSKQVLSNSYKYPSGYIMVG
ncbi:MAG: hypothetical protein EAZ55_12290 [Cytophagales bacterium]|nr:MAG: hypothetical protein EAZ55_12290 [Cytophagales bacterium]